MKRHSEHDKGLHWPGGLKPGDAVEWKLCNEDEWSDKVPGIVLDYCMGPLGAGVVPILVHRTSGKEVILFICADDLSPWEDTYI